MTSPDYHYRNDTKFPYLDEIPEGLDKDTVVKVYNVYGDTRIDLAGNLYWGYYHGMAGDLGEGVIYKWLVLSRKKTK